MRNSSIFNRARRGGAAVWILIIIVIAAVIWGGNNIYKARQAERQEQAEKQKEAQEKRRLAREELARQAEERRQAELERRRKQAEQANADLEKAKREQEEKEREEARRKAEEQAREQDEEARRKAEDEEYRRRLKELEEQEKNKLQEPDKEESYPKPFATELPDLSEYYPESRDVIPMNEDQVLGSWSWETAPKYDDITDFPTNEAKWDNRGKAGAIADTYRKWREQDAGRIKAIPSAKDFPGVPEDDADIVARTVTIDSSIGGWHSTGLYAPPGAEITFSFSGSASKDAVSVRIGCHTDDLMHEKTTSWSRLPIMGNTAPVNKTRVNLADPCGGLVYVCVNHANKHPRTFKVKISGATPAPLYIMGETTPEQWKEQLETTKAPWGEIRVPRLVFTMPTERLKECEQIKEVAELLQKCMALQDWVAGWDEFPERIKHPMRFAVDRQISIGYGHSGYPAMGSLDWANSLVTGSILTEGDWGLWHELGHNHQGNPVAMEGQTEVSVNIFSILCQSLGVGIDPRYVRGMSPTEIAPELSAYLADKNVPYIDAPNGVQLFLWGELMYNFGPQLFRDAHKMYHKRPYDGSKETDAGKWNWIMRAIGKSVQKDLSLYFETWKLPISKGTKTQLKKFPEWRPNKAYPAPNYIDAEQ